MPLDNTNEILASQFFEGWENGQNHFELFTSGSTGLPKSILLEREKMIWSAQKTKDTFFARTINKYQLCCLPVTKVGGLMQLVRSAVWHSPIDVVEASSNPLIEYFGPAQVASFTPMQLWHILNNEYSSEKLHQFHTVLIGGGSLSPEIEKKLIDIYPDTRWFHTFGMTETYSHFAGRLLGNEAYFVLPETEISQNELGALKLKNFLTNNEWVQTNDVVKLIDNTTFQWIGRTDFTINSGGFKIQLETVEKEIELQTHWATNSFFCWFKNDEELGQKLILITTLTNLPDEWNFSHAYFRPKEIIITKEIRFTETGKINRRESFESI